MLYQPTAILHTLTLENIGEGLKMEKILYILLVSLALQSCAFLGGKEAGNSFKPTRTLMLANTGDSEKLLGKCVIGLDTHELAATDACDAEFNKLYIKNEPEIYKAPSHRREFEKLDAKLSIKLLGFESKNAWEVNETKTAHVDMRKNHDITDDTIRRLQTFCIYDAKNPSKQFMVTKVFTGCSSASSYNTAGIDGSEFMKNFVKGDYKSEYTNTIGDLGTVGGANVCSSPSAISVNIKSMETLCDELLRVNMDYLYKKISTQKDTIKQLRSQNSEQEKAEKRSTKLRIDLEKSLGIERKRLSDIAKHNDNINEELASENERLGTENNSLKYNMKSFSNYEEKTSNKIEDLKLKLIAEKDKSIETSGKLNTEIEKLRNEVANLDTLIYNKKDEYEARLKNYKEVVSRTSFNASLCKKESKDLALSTTKQ